MNSKKYIWDFLSDLKKNNSKEWMDENRKRYQTAKEHWLDEVCGILKRLSRHDPFFDQFSPKDVIMRITNNRMFHPERPVYRTNFGFAPFPKDHPVAPLYFAFGPGFSMIGAGLHRPDKGVLNNVRGAIDYDANQLLEIIEADKFQELFGGLSHDENQLKTSPRGYPNDHPHVELLRRKSFTATYEPSQEDLINGNLADKVEEAYLVAQPLCKWLEKAAQEM